MTLPIDASGAKRPDISQPPRLLDRIDRPSDLKALSLSELEQLASEIRAEIVKTVTVNGGHLASSLGAVELTLALHYVFDAEKDLIVWDVGHQAYAHKLITGRRDRFDTIRKKGGLSGYPVPTESPYDAFGAGHSSTSISAALGMAVARDRLGEDRRVIAFIGDGAMTGGMALEALSHAGHLGTDLLVVLNDNEMSISPNVGALAAHLSRLITAQPYKKYKRDLGSYVKKFVGQRLTRFIQRTEAMIKGFITEGGLFQELGFNYIGPIDGHDLPTLIKFFTNIRNMNGPILCHCRTQKGRGHESAEADPQAYHGVKPSASAEIDVEGEARPPKRDPNGAVPTFTDVFADAVIDAARQDSRVCAITAAMPTGTGLAKFQQAFPDRCFDVSICEQHAVTFAAGLAARGMRPVCAIYSTFLQRGYDQYVHDVCLQNLPVVFAIDRGGLVGQDGPTHAGMFDLTYLRTIPNATVLAPRDDVDLRLMLAWALQQSGPVALRYPRCHAPTIGAIEGRHITRGQVLREADHANLIAVGPIVETCLEAADVLAAEGISVGVVDARCVKPLDGPLLDRLGHLPIVTVEENTILGGFGSAVIEHFDDEGRLEEKRIHRLGMPDRFVAHATRRQQLAQLGLDAKGIAGAVHAFLEHDVAQPTK
ncbi:MAG TPA: 1-deoxy-D-xylulose-5-phosphate synthase [Candidatus Hydrogenedentes bacterium]|nr:1-deoxy-D-xylulose-5-phosphate synthase [Candidatus Hydrogenedentota bacterium]HPG66657.1 1-deoxy-D-xylulose-5-phosphate synthase [Candidatus Hydrogenedentota bacterium]